MKSKGDIVYIDDEPEGLVALAKAEGSGQRLAGFTPDDLKRAAKAASSASLWVFDYFTVEQERVVPTLDAPGSSGLGVFHQFRRLLGEARPPSVLVSSHLEEAIGVFDYTRRHIVAEQLGVEWVSNKAKADEPIREIVALADAVASIVKAHKSLAEVDSARYPEAVASRVLRLPTAVAWNAVAVQDIDSWRPPATTSTPAENKTVGDLLLKLDPKLKLSRELVAWMVRQVLPYPSFLVRAPHVATRLGITLACLRSALAKKSKLAELLQSSLYGGVLAGFLGDRWWSAGVDALAFDVPRDAVQRKAHLKELVAPAALRELPIGEWVVVSDDELVETDEIALVGDCVRASDEHFPSQAPPAWVKIESAKASKVLARKVRLEDQNGLVT